MLIATRVAHRHIQHSDDGKFSGKLLDLKKTIFHVLYIFLEKSSGERGDQTVGDSPPFLLPIGSILGDLEVVICIACWRKF